ncbi:MAG: tetratricopeptide repeat protein [Nitrospirae bacterium]|nr:tetratricopeptide repeat protein [Nitrospirota bacterium]
MKAVGYNQTGIEAVEAGDYNRALIEFKRSLSLNSGLDNRNGVAINYLNLGRLYLLMDSLDDAKRLFGESIKIGLDINDQFILSEAYASIGRYYYLSGNSKEAIDILEKAAAIDRKEGYATIGSKLNIMGIVYRDDDRLNEAERAFNDALNISKSYKMDEDTADSFRGLGDIFFKKRDYKKARESYESAISIDRRLGIRSKISLDLFSLGTLSLRENDANGALDLFLRAYAVDSGRGDNKRTLKDLDRIIEIYKESGDKNNADAYSLEKERRLRKE